jgi:Tfp pilus assembly protein PilF
MKCFLASAPLLFLGLSQFGAASSSCESSPAVETAMRNLDQKLENVTFEQSLTLQEQAYHDLVQLDPLDIRPVRRYIQHVHYDVPERQDSLRNSLVSEARSHPKDPIKLLTAALVLEGKDTPQALHFMDQALAPDPGYAPAYVALTGLYNNSGKFTDKSKAATYLQKYYRLCPSSRDGYAMFYLKQLGSNELKSEVAKNLRQRLAAITDAHALRSYSDIWSLEFSTLPVTDHPKERQRIADDLNHLQQLPVQATAEWLDLLKDGYKQSGAPEARVQSIENRILKEFPHSSEAFGISYHNWTDQHPQPAGEASASDWQQYMRLALAHYRELIRLFPQEHGFGYYVVEYTSNLERTSNEEIAREGEAYIRQSDLYEGESSWPRQYVAGIFLDHKIEPSRALALLQTARRLKDSPRERVLSETPDYAKPKEIEDSAQKRSIEQAEFRVLYLRACRAANDKAAAEELKASLESAPPANAKLNEPYWNGRAILAEIEGHDMDALAFYQKALFLREPPQKQYGRLHDRLLE